MYHRDSQLSKLITKIAKEVIPERWDDPLLTEAIINSNLDYIANEYNLYGSDKIHNSLDYILSQSNINIDTEVWDYLFNLNSGHINNLLKRYSINIINMSLSKYLILHNKDYKKVLFEVVHSYVKSWNDMTDIQQYKELLLYTIDQFEDKLTLNDMYNKSMFRGISRGTSYMSRYIEQDAINYIVFKIISSCLSRNDISNIINDMNKLKITFLIKEAIKHDAASLIKNTLMKILLKQNDVNELLESISKTELLIKPKDYVSLFEEDI